VVGSYQNSVQNQSLLCLPFTTIFEYLFYLRTVALCLGRGAMVYLAAAVADFYVPHESMVGKVKGNLSEGTLVRLYTFYHFGLIAILLGFLFHN